jgi:conjugative transfer signal peptidase TraF
MLHAGDLVIMDLPEQAKPYVYGRLWLQPGWPLLKNVGAVAGDEYQITAAAITVNGKNCGPVFAVDGRGRALPRLRGCFKVIDGYFLPLSTFSRSFDGRYFGTAPLKLIRGKAIPILIF